MRPSIPVSRQHFAHFLALDRKQESKDAIALINKITQEAERNAIIHGQVFMAGESMMFVHRKVDQDLRAKAVRVDSELMRQRARDLQNNITKLQSLLSVSDDDLQEFGKIGSILASRSATSPKPPSSKTS